jgi:hypothetical protein
MAVLARARRCLGNPAAGPLALTVAGFAAGTTREQQQATLDSLIDQWAQPSGKVDTDYTRPVFRTVLSDDGPPDRAPCRHGPGADPRAALTDLVELNRYAVRTWTASASTG